MSDFVGSLHLTDPWATGTPDYSAVGGSPANDDAFGDDKLDFFNDAVDMLDAEQQGWTYETIAAAPEQVFEVFNSSTPSPTGPANSLVRLVFFSYDFLNNYIYSFLLFLYIFLGFARSYLESVFVLNCLVDRGFSCRKR